MGRVVYGHNIIISVGVESGFVEIGITSFNTYPADISNSYFEIAIPCRCYLLKLIVFRPESGFFQYVLWK
jgi:hypothetical protein